MRDTHYVIFGQQFHCVATSKNRSNFRGIKSYPTKESCAIRIKNSSHFPGERMLRNIRKSSSNFPGEPFSNFRKNTYDFLGGHTPKNSYFE